MNTPPAPDPHPAPQRPAETPSALRPEDVPDELVVLAAEIEAEALDDLRRASLLKEAR